MTTIKVKARLHPTEDPEKVAVAITNLFGDIELRLDEEKGLLYGVINEKEQLLNLRNTISRDRIRSTLNRTLSRWADEDYLSFGFNRQAAYAGHVSLNLTNEDPLDPIQVQIRGDVQDIIEYLTR